MKKLIVGALLIVASLSVRAASVQWVLAGVYQPETTTAASNYAAYLFSTDVSQNSVVASIMAKTFAEDYASLALASASTNTSGMLSVANIGNYTGTTADPTTIYLYSVLLNTDINSLADATYYAISGTPVDVTFTSATGTKTALFTGFSAANEWQPIPEPTSGMLLLVGCALMALKRKRA